MRGGKEVCNGSPLRRYAAALSCRACPLRHLRCHLSQRERLWQAGTLFTGRLRLDRAQKGGPCYRGQQLLDKRTLSSCRWPRQRSTAASEILCFAHPDETCPTCQGLPLWGSWRAQARLRGQGCCQTALHCDSIAPTKSLPIAARRLFRAGLALSVTPVACHLSQRERPWQSPQSERFRQRLPY